MVVYEKLVWGGLVYLFEHAWGPFLPSSYLPSPRINFHQPLEFSIKYPKLGILGPSFSPTGGGREDKKKFLWPYILLISTKWRSQ
jgi:hypothetical protein